MIGRMTDWQRKCFDLRKFSGSEQVDREAVQPGMNEDLIWEWYPILNDDASVVQRKQGISKIILKVMKKISTKNKSHISTQEDEKRPAEKIILRSKMSRKQTPVISYFTAQ